MVERGEHKQACEHFREALRIDPELEWARQGILHAMRARNPIYRVILKFFLFMAKLSDKAQWGVIIGLYFGQRVLRGIAKANPALEPYVMPILVLYLGFCLLTWVANPLFNLVLRLDKFGRLVLDDDERAASNWIGLCLVGFVVFLVVGLITKVTGILLLAAVCGLLMIPVSGTYACELGWPRKSMTIYTAVLAVAGIGGALLELAGIQQGFALFIVFLLGTFAFGWVGNFVARAQPVKS